MWRRWRVGKTQVVRMVVLTMVTGVIAMAGIPTIERLGGDRVYKTYKSSLPILGKLFINQLNVFHHE